jgi:hypothetical protein
MQRSALQSCGTYSSSCVSESQYKNNSRGTRIKSFDQTGLKTPHRKINLTGPSVDNPDKVSRTRDGRSQSWFRTVSPDGCLSTLMHSELRVILLVIREIRLCFWYFPGGGVISCSCAHTAVLPTVCSVPKCEQRTNTVWAVIRMLSWCWNPLRWMKLSSIQSSGMCRRVVLVRTDDCLLFYM